MSNRERILIGRKRLLSVLENQYVANIRTLEQKISDAGPYDQRVDPHNLGEACTELLNERRIAQIKEGGTKWFHRTDTRPGLVKKKLDKLVPLYESLNTKDMRMRVGQCAEIAVFRNLLNQDELDYMGGYADLDAHDDSTNYSKIEPPSFLNGRFIGRKKLDFLIQHNDAGWGGVEVKNKRQWLYPRSSDIIDTLDKCLTLDVVPIIIARRIQYSTMRLFIPCGIIFHEFFNQMLPRSATRIAKRARDKDLLGYHDIRVGNAPFGSSENEHHGRLRRFISQNLPSAMEMAREKFNYNRDLLKGYVSKSMSYEEFSARLRRREAGGNEDYDPGG